MTPSCHENRIIAVKELMRALASVAPTVLEVEDTHWLDASTAAWLTAMTRNIATLPLAILCTSRFSDDGTKPELQVAQDVELKDYELQPITGEEFTQQMAKALLGEATELDTETVKLISGKAKGNPFFTEQLILHLNETGELEKVQSPAAGDESTKTRTRLRMKSNDTARLPGSLSSLVTARIDRLSPEVRETVKHASILGVRFLSRVLGELLERSGKVSRSLEELLIESEKEGVLVPAERTETNDDAAQ
jgi:predicted ATPase